MGSTGNVLRLPTEEMMDYLRIAYYREVVTPKWKGKCPVEIEKPPGGVPFFSLLYIFYIEIIYNNIIELETDKIVTEE